MKVEDIAPCMLYLLGEEIPEGLDGSIPEKWLEKEYSEKHPARFCAPEAPRREPEDIEGNEIQKRLKGLGYMS
jgi:hypothetical protein